LNFIRQKPGRFRDFYFPGKEASDETQTVNWKGATASPPNVPVAGKQEKEPRV